jgi:Bifunctional DNA primase/polymerase, N-terminal/Protein of unknown function (DUF3987)
MDSPFAQVGSALLSLGYSPIPIQPGEKKPGHYDGDAWGFLKGWNQYCTEKPSTFQVNHWSKWPRAGVGVACGMGLVCIDIDRDDLIDPVCALLPPSLVQKKGRKGLSLFYRGNTDVIRSRNFRTPDRIGLLDLLAEGKQTVLPPSIHPDSGEPYFWYTDDSLLDVRLQDLTELTNDVAAQLGELLKAYGYDPDHERIELPANDGDDTSAIHAQNFFRQLNEDALANISAWAPKLGLPKGRMMGRIYRAVAPWRSSGSGRSMERRSRNLSISPGGIEDFGTGENFTALNVVMKAMDIPQSNLDDAVQWLGAQLGHGFNDVEVDLVTSWERKKLAEAAKPKERPAPRLEPVMTIVRDVATDRIEAPVILAPTDNLAGLLAPAPAMPVEALTGAVQASDDEAAPDEGEDETAPSMAELEALCYPPGLVGEIVKWIEGSSSSPSRPLALAAALPFVGTLCARHQSGPTDLRTNLYVVALAPSGYGKDFARKAISRLAGACGLDRMLGPENFLSDSAMRKTIEHTPALLSLMDEFGGFVGKIMDRRAGSHQSNMRQMLMQLFTTSDDVYRGSAAAQDAATPIYNPCFSIYGTSTPTDFWNAMSSKGIADGFLPRWLVVTMTGEPERDVAPSIPKTPPVALVEACKSVYKESRSGNMADVTHGRVKARMAPFAKGGEEAFRRWRDIFHARAKRTQPDLAVLWTRSMEIALRLAHIVAVGCDPIKPEVTGPLVDWAAKLTELSTRSCIVEVRDRLASNDKQAEYVKVRRWIKESEDTGVSATQLKRMVNGEFDLRRLEDITKQLSESGQIELRRSTTPKGGRPGYRWFLIGGKKE